MSETPRRPDVILFMCDQLAARWLESPAAEAIPLPNLQRLKQRGVTFRRCYTSNPVCMPARATIATGLSSRQHGVLQNGYALDPRLPTFMRSLRDSEYHTVILGKQHFAPHFAGVYPETEAYGWAEAHITEDARAGQWLDWVKTHHPEHYEAALAGIWCSGLPEFSEYGDPPRDLRAEIVAARQAMDWRTERFPGNTGQHHTLPFPPEVSQTEWITKHAERVIRDTPADTPLLAQISYVQPHSPFCPPEHTMDRVNLDKLPAPAPAEWRDDPLGPACFRGWQIAERAAGVSDWRAFRQYYFADLTHLDDQLGRVLDALRDADRLENAVILFFADHGEMLLDHGLLAKGEMHYDACVRVPLIVAGPGLNQDSACDDLVQLEDICPTVLEAAGCDRPTPAVLGGYMKGDVGDSLPGRSLLPLARGQHPPDWRNVAYVESYNNIDSCDTSRWARTVITDTHRYTMYPGAAGEQLFDLEYDPQEQRNLAGEAQSRSLRDGLRDTLLDQVILQDYPHPVRNLFALGVH